MSAASPAGAAAAAAAAGAAPAAGRASLLSSLLARLSRFLPASPLLRWASYGALGVGFLLWVARYLYRRFLAKYRGRDLAATALQPEYDYIVVGAGSAGAAVAARLAEQDSRISVLLLEAGGSDDIMPIHVPAAAIKLQRQAATDYCYVTEPQKDAHLNMEGRRGHWPRGKVMGGCSSLNYMLFVRGAPVDFDTWAAEGCGEDWSFKSLLPYFKRLESVSKSTSTVPSSEWRGEDGPMACNLIISPQEATFAFMDAAEASGIKRNPDYNGADIYGVGMSQYNVRGGRRWNTASGYIVPALSKHPNLHVLMHAHVQRVLFNDAKEAQGVALKRGSDLEKLREQPEMFIRARREVILSAGAVGSPQLLELSGIGQSKLLTPLGIKMVADLPGVGENLQDHLACPVMHESAVRTLSPADVSVQNLWRWLRHGDGPLSGNFVEALAWLNTPAHPLARIPPSMPDMQFHFLVGTLSPDDFHVFNSKEGNADRMRKLIAEGMQYTSAIMPTLLHPRSRGWVHIRSRSAATPPIIQPNYFTESADVTCMVEACKIALRMYEQAALKKITKRLLTDAMCPNNPYSLEAQPDQYWEWYVRHQANTLYHPVGTCKMGSASDASAVVDPRLRVLGGVKRLRVADASVMPLIVSGNTNVPAIMIGEKCADLCRQDREEEERAAKQGRAR